MLSKIRAAMTIAAFPSMSDEDKLKTLAKAAQQIASTVLGCASGNWRLSPAEQQRVDELRAPQAQHISEGNRLLREAGIAAMDGNAGTATRLTFLAKQELDIGAKYGRMANDIECRPPHLRPTVPEIEETVLDDRDVWLPRPDPIGPNPINPAPIGW